MLTHTHTPRRNAAERLLREINILRGVSGLGALGRIEYGNDAYDTIGSAVAQPVTLAWERRPPYFRRSGSRLTVELGSREATASAASRLGRRFEKRTGRFLATEAMEGFVMADTFGLCFFDQPTDWPATLKGWIEPSTNRRTWELHLIPGTSYPPGHDRSAGGTVVTMRRWLNR